MLLGGPVEWTPLVSPCFAAGINMAARIVMDAALTYAWGSGASLVIEGAMLWGTGAAISSGVIQTATVTSAASLGSVEMMAGRAAVAAGVERVGVAQVGVGVSLLPTNAWDYYDTFSNACF
jgi:hypothetical protein